MTTVILVAGLVFSLGAAAALASTRSATHPVEGSAQAMDPVDHAERILASRYARGTITSDEYERMLAVLRR